MHEKSGHGEMLQFIPKLSSHVIYYCIVSGQLCPKPNRGRLFLSFIGSWACVQLLSHVSTRERITWRCRQSGNRHGQTFSEDLWLSPESTLLG